MTRPVVHPAAEQVYRLLPDFMRSADEIEQIDYTALRYVAGASVGLEKAADFLTIVDPDTSVTGTCELVNADACPRPYLGWLGWLVGINVDALPVEQARVTVGNAGNAQRRGSRKAISSAVSWTLTEPSPAPRVWANFSGSDPYLITVVTNTSQTPDETATLLAAETEKPAGMTIELQVVVGTIIAEMEYAYPTVADLEAAFATVADIEAWIPTT